MGSMGGKGGSSAPAQAEPTVVNNSNPAMDMYLAEQANQNQMAMQNQAQNAQMMQAQMLPSTQQVGMKPAQQQEQNGLGEEYDPNTQLAATLQALRGN